MKNTKPTSYNNRINLLNVLNEIEECVDVSNFGPDDYIKLINKSLKVKEALELVIPNVNKIEQSIISSISSDDFVLNLLYTYCDIKSIEVIDNENNDYVGGIVNMYLNEIYKISMLSDNELNKLVYQAQNGDKKSANKIVESNLRLVVRVANNYLGRGIPFEDLIQEGNLGLIRSIQSYDPTKGKFGTYACWWIRQSIMKYIAAQSKLFHISTNSFQIINRIKKIKYDYFLKYGKDPTILEIANLSGYKVFEIKEFLQMDLSIESLNKTILNDDSSENEYINNLVDYESSIEEQVERKDLSFLLKKILIESSLNKQEKMVLESRLGFYNDKIYTLSEIGDTIDLSRERVRQIEASALKKINNPKNKRLLNALSQYLDRPDNVRSYIKTGNQKKL